VQSFGPVDPFQLVKEEIDSVSERLRRSIFTGVPTLRTAAQYFFKVRKSVLARMYACSLQSCDNLLAGMAKACDCRTVSGALRFSLYSLARHIGMCAVGLLLDNFIVRLCSHSGCMKIHLQEARIEFAEVRGDYAGRSRGKAVQTNNAPADGIFSFVCHAQSRLPYSR